MRTERAPDALRAVEIIPRFTKAPAGSALIRCGGTTVLCTVSAVEGVPRFREGRGGWLTAEYAMAPGSTPSRSARESSTGKVKGRTHEIQRLVGRSLRAAIDLERLGEWTLHVDCEVLEADAGTRTASITGGFVALALAVDHLMDRGALASNPLRAAVAGVSCGIVRGQALLDLDYGEDVQATVDANFVRATPGGWIEVQATGEDGAYTRTELDALLDLAERGIDNLHAAQRAALGAAAERVWPKEIADG
ncbi:MAG: ribonuclease PH [Deltaproteobacteria bacterium]|nr:MAG: ribonuclease PH [Deltaproteobacteria bacterium]